MSQYWYGQIHDGPKVGFKLSDVKEWIEHSPTTVLVTFYNDCGHIIEASFEQFSEEMVLYGQYNLGIRGRRENATS